MSSNTKNFLLFLVLAAGMGGVWWFADQQGWLPRPAPKKELTEEEKADVQKKIDEDTKKREEEAKAKKDARPPAPPAPPANAAPAKTEPFTLIPLGGDNFYNRVLLNTRGGGVQQIVLPSFQEADRLGRDVKQNDAAVPLFLVPGTVPQRGPFLKEPFHVPDLKPGLMTDATGLLDTSYTVLHYAGPEDKHPDPLLGSVNWRVVAEEHPADGTHKVVFEYDLGDPYYVKIRKTFTVAPKDYHVSMTLEFSKLPSSTPRTKFRFQVTGPRGLPVEGEWYNSVSRVALIGWETPKGAAKREYEDAATVAVNRGGEQFLVGENKLKYAAIATQYFVSALAVDTLPALERGKTPFSYVRATTEVPFDRKADKNTPQFEDITFRVVSDLEIVENKPAVYGFAIYNGPSKVRLLKLLEGDKAVDPGLVDRYLNDFSLKTVTDYRSPTTLGWVADKIFWTDLVVVFTNLMHGLLYAIHLVVRDWALSIFVLTVIVRLCLFIPSRKQTQMNLRMMEVQKKMQPEIEKLKEKYKDDFHSFNREKTRLMMQNGFNPFAMMGGCLLLFAQMPIMMGLYFALQESIFFRLEPFLWIDNLAAPDMTVWWSEQIPWVSTPSDIGSFYYLGPFLNVLPIVAVGLMMYQQAKMMPPPTDEQMAAQQKMMKWMMVVIAVMFYKVAAGLALYFIIGSVWGILERRLIPKPADKKPDADGAAADEEKPRGALGRFRERLKKKMEELQKHAEQQSDRQVRNDPNKPQPDRKDRKKKRRK